MANKVWRQAVGALKADKRRKKQARAAAKNKPPAKPVIVRGPVSLEFRMRMARKGVVLVEEVSRD